MDEVWKTIEEFPNYQISNLGNVKSLTKNRLLSTTAKKHLYASLNLGQSYKGNNTRRYVHRLVATYFLPNPKNDSEVNHKDGNKRNNNAENLEWCTHEANMKHAWKKGLIVGVVKKKRNSK